MILLPYEVATLIALIPSRARVNEIIDRISLWSGEEIILDDSAIRRLLQGWGNGDGNDYSGGLVANGLVIETRINSRVKFYELSNSGRALADKYYKTLWSLVENCK